MSVTQNVGAKRSEDKIVILGRSLKVFSEESIPKKTRAVSSQLIEDLLQLGKGKAIAVTKADFGISPNSMRARINRLKSLGKLPKNYELYGRTIDGKQILYIVNSAKAHE